MHCRAKTMINVAVALGAVLTFAYVAAGGARSCPRQRTVPARTHLADHNDRHAIRDERPEERRGCSNNGRAPEAGNVA
jgi:hypothetical protein